jgi:hypothetical protein
MGIHDYSGFCSPSTFIVLLALYPSILQTSGPRRFPPTVLPFSVLKPLTFRPMMFMNGRFSLLFASTSDGVQGQAEKDLDTCI